MQKEMSYNDSVEHFLKHLQLNKKPLIGVHKRQPTNRIHREGYIHLFLLCLAFIENNYKNLTMLRLSTRHSYKLNK